MLINFLKTAWRGLLRGRSFSIINISGLIVGMAGATLILLWLVNEVSYDRFHVNVDRIYQLYVKTDIPGEKHFTIGVVSQPLGPAIKASFRRWNPLPGSRTSIISFSPPAIKVLPGLRGTLSISTSSTSSAFRWLPVTGSQPLGSVFSIVLTEKLARKLFGSTDVVGKMLRIDSTDNFTVTGVLKTPLQHRIRFRIPACPGAT